MIRESLAVAAAAAAVILSASPAYAAPVQDSGTYCAPGTSYSYYDVHSGDIVTNCNGKPRHALIRYERPFNLFDPSTW